MGDINEENLSETQLEILTLAYNEWPHPFDELVDQLVIETGLEKQGVKNWFWNRTWEKIKTARKKAKKEKARMIREKINMKKVDETKSQSKKSVQAVQNASKNVEDEFGHESEKQGIKEVSRKRSYKTKGGKTRLAPEVEKILIEAYDNHPGKPSANPELLKEVSCKTGLKKTVIQRWFVNRKFRLAKKSEK